MIAAWMAYCVMCGVIAATVGALGERMALGRGWPVRTVWSVALVLALVMPAIALVVASSRDAGARIPIRPAVIMSTAPSSPSHDMPEIITTSVGSPSAWREAALSFDRPLLFGWAVMSVLILSWYAAAMLTLTLLQRRWHVRVVRGVPVFVSENTGPAVAGVIRSRIVFPAWVLALEPTAIDLMLRHELEHQQARDPLLLTAARLSVALMPWNPALWWMLRRLHLAVELDCDARVLRDAPDVRSYGSLLIEIGRWDNQQRWLGAAAFADRASHLERRILVMITGRAPAGRIATLSSALGIGALVAVACAAPVPATPALAAKRDPAASTAAIAPPASEASPASAASSKVTSPDPNETTAKTITEPQPSAEPARIAAMSVLADANEAPARRAAGAASNAESAIEAANVASRLYTEGVVVTAGATGAGGSARSAAPAQGMPAGALGCATFETGTPRVEIVVEDYEVDNRQHVTVLSLPKDDDGVEMRTTGAVDATKHVTCEMPTTGMLRAYGRLRSVRLLSHGIPDLTLVVTTRSGQQIAGPFAANPSAGQFDVSWGKP